MTDYYLNTTAIKIPQWMMSLSYNGRIIPNGKQYDLPLDGANCQVFAFTLLRLNNRVVPEYRSSELWADEEFSTQVGTYQPLDLLFFHNKREAYGAHVGIYIGNNQVLHHSKSIGKPVVWNLEDFAEDPKYLFFLGAKRFKTV